MAVIFMRLKSTNYEIKVKIKNSEVKKIVIDKIEIMRKIQNYDF